MRERLNWIDWLKVLVVFGAFVFHAAQPFTPTGWLVTSNQTSVALSLYSGFGYLFGMPLMFVLGGATTWLATDRSGLAGHAMQRIRRLVIPLALGLVILSPLQAWLATMASGSLADPGTFLSSYLGHLRFYPSPTWFGDYGYHLWFLAFLFADVLLVMPLLPRVRAARDAGRLRVGRFANGRGGLALLFGGLLVPQLVLRPLFPVYRDWADFVLWLCYFWLGVLAMADRELLDAILARRRLLLWLVPVCLLLLVPLLPLGSPLDFENQPGYTVAGLAYGAWRTLLGWVMVLSLVGFGATFLTARPPFLGWASRRVLPFYVLHHPVVVPIAALVVGNGSGLWAQYGLIVAVSLAGTLLLCEAAVRLPTLLGRRGVRV
jgi:surface polysaccharide O-acyltransferase-like enzyme